MARALTLAARGRCTTHPNPRVGCVVVQGGEIVGEGWHERAGEPHAEVHALRAAGDKARGAELFVSLEPCSHHGRTPPCADALIAAGVRKVWAAMPDPNPLVAGQGVERLRAAGIEVELGLMQATAEKLNRGYVSRMRRGRPFVTLKLAASLDGRTAMASGESRWITSAAARADVHRLRAEAGAVLTSGATVLADNPALTARELSPLPERQPDRIVLDSRGRVPLDARVWLPGARRFWLVSDLPPPLAGEGRGGGVAAGVERIVLAPADDGHLPLARVLTELGRREVNEVLVESGPQLAGALLQSHLVDELVLYLASSLLGHEARALAQLPGLAQIEQRITLKFIDTRMVGGDLRLTAVPVQ